VRPTRYNK